MRGLAGPDLPALGDAVGRLGPTDRVVVVAYLVIGVALVVDLGRPRRDSNGINGTRLASLTATALGSLVVAVPFAALVGHEWVALRHLSPPGLADWWSAHPVPAFVACFVAVDLVAYLYHLSGHRTQVGWASHRVHHLGPDFDMSLALRQPWLPVHGLFVVPLPAIGGFSLEMVAACSAISLAYQAVQHTSREWRLGALEVVLVSGRAHRHHHSIDGDVANLGAVLSVWDRAFGTLRSGPVAPGALFGSGEPEPINPLRIQTEGWRRLVSGASRTGGAVKDQAGR